MKSLKVFILIMVVCASLFALGPWNKYELNPVLEGKGGNTWDAHMVQCDVIYHNDTLRMWFASHNGLVWKTMIGYAWSLDGVTWNQHPDPVMSYTDQSWINNLIWCPSVIYDDSLDCYRMWYTGDYRYAGYAESSDGINWTHHPTALNAPFNSNTVWGSSRFMITEVLKDDNVYKAWYTTWADNLSIWYAQTGYAESLDGINWVRHTDPVILRGVRGSWDDNLLLTYSVLKMDGDYMAWYCACDDGQERYQVGCAYSKDGITWTKDHRNPVVPRGTTGAYDADMILGPAVIKSPGFAEFPELWMWYRCLDVDNEDMSKNNNDISFAKAGFINNRISMIPTEFELYQNYPNPFNPRTAISYQLTVESEVELSIYDITGRKITTLINEYQSSGYHTVNWDASGFFSGIYFYRLVSGNSVETKKMVLMK